MAAPTVIHGESHPHMAGTAKITVDIPLHGKGFGPLLLDIEDIGVAARTVKFCKMILMGKGNITAGRSCTKLYRGSQFIR